MTTIEEIAALGLRGRLNCKAYGAVKEARKRGALATEPCVCCGSDDAIAHHYNYSRPLDVIWLCRSCHAKVHLRIANLGNDRCVRDHPAYLPHKEPGEWLRLSATMRQIADQSERSCHEAANAMGMSPGAVARWIKGLSRSGLGRFVTWCRAYGVTPQALISTLDKED